MIKDSYINDQPINIPEQYSEIKLSNLIGFDVVCDYLALMDEESENKQLYIQAMAISVFYGLDLIDMFDLPLDLEGVDPTKVSLTLNSLFDYALGKRMELQEHDFGNETEITYNGITYDLPHILTNQFNTDIPSEIKAGEAIELLLIQKLLNNNKAQITKKTEIDDLEVIAQQRYAHYLNMVAILYKPKGTKNPLDEKIFTIEVNKRMKELKDIDVESAYRAIFFLTKNIFRDSLKWKSLNTSLIHREVSQKEKR